MKQPTKQCSICKENKPLGFMFLNGKMQIVCMECQLCVMAQLNGWSLEDCQEIVDFWSIT